MVGLSPSTPRNLFDSHACRISTLQVTSHRPSLVTNEVVTYGSILMDLAVAQDSETKPSWFLVFVTHAKRSKSNKLITLLKLYSASILAV